MEIMYSKHIIKDFKKDYDTQKIYKNNYIYFTYMRCLYVYNIKDKNIVNKLPFNMFFYILLDSCVCDDSNDNTIFLYNIRLNRIEEFSIYNYENKIYIINDNYNKINKNMIIASDKKIFINKKYKTINITYKNNKNICLSYYELNKNINICKIQADIYDICNFNQYDYFDIYFLYFNINGINYCVKLINHKQIILYNMDTKKYKILLYNKKDYIYKIYNYYDYLLIVKYYKDDNYYIKKILIINIINYEIIYKSNNMLIECNMFYLGNNKLFYVLTNYTNLNTYIFNIKYLLRLYWYSAIYRIN